MKEIKHIMLFLAVGTLLLSCSNDKEGVEKAALGYLNAMGNYKPSEARPFATVETVNTTISFYEMMVKYTDSSVYSNNIPAIITITSTSIEDSSAQVCFHKSTPTVEQDGTIDLIKTNGHWLVDQVLDIPRFPQPDDSCRTFSQEEITEMRENNQKR